MNVLRSLPSRERGLKFPSYRVQKYPGRSLPSRERGLKYRNADTYDRVGGVAPFAGAWIEISVIIFSSCSPSVAPFAGAWIEM